MLDPLLLTLSLFSVIGGALIILFPNLVVKLNMMLTRPLVLMDPWLLRYRHLLGLLLFLAGYAVFYTAILLLPYRA